MIRYTSIQTSYGPVFIAKAGRGICQIKLGGTEQKFKATLSARIKEEATRDDQALSNEAQQLSSYFDQGKPLSPMQIEYREGTPFEQSVWRTLEEIPRGQVRSYSWVAKQIGNPKASRAVGSACGSNPIPFLVPCHRVVASDGSLGGYGYGLPVKRRLLEAEGADLSALKN